MNESVKLAGLQDVGVCGKRGMASAAVLCTLVCPACSGRLEQVEHVSAGGASSSVECRACGASFPVRNSIPRFVPSDNYASNFGFQWLRHSRTQVDVDSGLSLSRDRFFATTVWPVDLTGERILEAGCGSGRFTQVALATGAEVFAFDYSDAVDANLAVNGTHPRLRLFQADIARLPLRPGGFDKVLCLGVLQHCPAPKQAFLTLTRHLKPGGEIAVDVYCRRLRDYVNPATWIRLITRRMDHGRLYDLVRAVVPKLLPLKLWVSRKLPFGLYFAFFIPIVCHVRLLEQGYDLTETQLLEWAVLDTFDHYSARYDQPQRIGVVRQWLREAGLHNAVVMPGPNGITARGTRPE